MSESKTRYVRVATRLWNDEKWRAIENEDAKWLYLYLLTSPHSTMTGIFVMPKLYICHDLTWSMERLEEPFGQLLSMGLIRYDETVSVVLLPNFLKYNPIQNPNQASAALKKIEELPQTPLISELKLLRKGLDKHLPDGCPNGIGNTVAVSVAVSGTVSEEKEPEDSSSFEDPMGYLPKEEGEDKIVDTVLEAYKRIYDKPGYKLNSKVRSRILNRHREYKERTPDGYETSVIYVLEKAKRAGDNGDQFYKKNCALNQLVSSGMFENIFENTEDTREVPEGFFKHTDGRILPNDHFKEKKG